ncbi:SDR family NAD(P)-dependent oxidoreductase [Aerococcus tenax]|uniref:SDR family NAD(P)-dependent oxidoreductase n=1 Tax=Aerococcus tenax TaxID=3078812 RepID=UPI0018A6D89E|nr:SDR family NAD(P)-dependent oxidoreductase [Aerococcus tenax]
MPLSEKASSGQWALVTGASSGIGRATAVALAKAGYSLLLTARHQERLEESKQLCIEAGAKAVDIFPADLKDLETVDRLVHYAFERYSIRIVVHSAGLGYFERVIQQSDAHALEQINTNLISAIYLCQRVAIAMLDQDLSKTYLVILASIAARIQTAGNASYAASKAGLLAFANGLRQELWTTPIQVMTVLPGPVKTAFFDQADPSGQFIQAVDSFTVEAEKVAQAICQGIKRNKMEVVVPNYYAYLNKILSLSVPLGYRLIHWTMARIKSR